MFLDGDANYNDEFERDKNLFKISEVQDQLQTSVSNYYNLFSDSKDEFDLYTALLNNRNQQLEPSMFIDYVTEPINPQQDQFVYYLTEDNLGPFSQYTGIQLKNYIRSVQTIQVNYTIMHQVPRDSYAESSCYIWDILQNFDFYQRSTMKLTLTFHKQPCTLNSYNLKQFVWVSVCLVLLALVSIGLHVKYLFSIRGRYEKLRKRYDLKMEAYKIATNNNGQNNQNDSQQYESQFYQLNGSQGSSEYIKTVQKGRATLMKSYSRIQDENQAYKQHLRSQKSLKSPRKNTFTINELENDNSEIVIQVDEISHDKFGQNNQNLQQLTTSKQIVIDPADDNSQELIDKEDSFFEENKQDYDQINNQLRVIEDKKQKPRRSITLKPQASDALQIMISNDDDAITHKDKELQNNQDGSQQDNFQGDETNPPAKNSVNQNQNLHNLLETSNNDNNYQNEEQFPNLAWVDLPIWEKSKLINKFTFVALIGNFCQVTGSILYFLRPIREVEFDEILIGFGCLLAWATLPKYFMYSQRYSLILRTMEFSFPILTRALLGIIPFFIGYAILGQCLFWPFQNRFGTFSNAFMQLFCMMNGDNLVPIHQDLTSYDVVLGNLYLYVYIFLSIVVIMNIFIIIIEQGYLSVKYKRAYDWLDYNANLNQQEDQDQNEMPEEIKLSSGNQLAYEKEVFIKLRDAFEGITDGDVYGKGMPIDNHPIPKQNNQEISGTSQKSQSSFFSRQPSFFTNNLAKKQQQSLNQQNNNTLITNNERDQVRREYKKQQSKLVLNELLSEEEFEINSKQ
eukprot:403361598